MNEWQQAKKEEIIGGICGHYRPQILKSPEKALILIEQEIDSQVVFLGNDWLGRGVVVDTVINATIEGLEIVRGDCLAAIQKKSDSAKSALCTV